MRRLVLNGCCDLSVSGSYRFESDCDRSLLSENLGMDAGTAIKRRRFIICHPTMVDLPRRTLCADGERHCSPPDELDTDLNYDPDREDSLEECVADDSGNFGPDGAYQAPVLYRYQVQTTLELTASGVNGGVLVLLEKALADLLIQDVFDGRACQITTRRFLQVEEQALPIGANDLTGLRSTPDDKLASGVEGGKLRGLVKVFVLPLAHTAAVLCQTPLVEGADRCFIINGGLTLVGDDDVNWAVPIALDLVEWTMYDGLLNNVHPDVVDVQFLHATEGVGDTGEVIELPPSPTPLYGSPSGARDGNPNQAWPWVILGGGLFILLAAVVLARRRLRSDREDFEEVSRRPGTSSIISSVACSTYMNDEPPYHPLVLAESESPRHLFIDDDDSFDQKRRNFV